MAMRRASAQGVLLSQAVASRVGMHPSDLECLDVVNMGEAVTAGDLARATGLTTGAITAVIDRLEKAGYVRREPDPADRRRVLVRVRPESMAPLDAIYGPLAARMGALWDELTDEQLEVVRGFMTRSLALSIAFTEEVRRGGEGAKAASTAKAPAAIGGEAPVVKRPSSRKRRA